MCWKKRQKNNSAIVPKEIFKYQIKIIHLGRNITIQNFTDCNMPEPVIKKKKQPQQPSFYLLRTVHIDAIVRIKIKTFWFYLSFQFFNTEHRRIFVISERIRWSNSGILASICSNAKAICKPVSNSSFKTHEQHFLKLFSVKGFIYLFFFSTPQEIWVLS